MNINQLVSFLRMNIDTARAWKGCTGFTMNPTTGLCDRMERGTFVYSLKGGEMSLPADRTPPDALLRAWLAHVWLPLAHSGGMGGHREHESGGGYADNVKPNHYIGAWIDDGRLYLDCSVVTTERTAASQFSAANGQKAYWDVSAGRAVPAGS